MTDCPYAAGRLPDMICEFCEIPICLKCERQNSFGSCCAACHMDVENAVIGETSAVDRRPWKCGGFLRKAGFNKNRHGRQVK